MINLFYSRNIRVYDFIYEWQNDLGSQILLPPSKQFKFHFFTSNRINRDVSKLPQLFLPFFHVRVDEHSFESLYE